MKTKRLLFFSLILLLVSMACSSRPFWVGPVAGPIEQTETPIVGIGTKNFNHGELIILHEQATITTTNEGWFKPQYGCWPTSYYDDGGGYLKIINGVILGYCKWTSPSAILPSVTWNNKGNLQGNLIDSTRVQFEFDNQADYFSYTIDIKFIGVGTMKDYSHAEGTASFTATCTSAIPEPSCTFLIGDEIITRKSFQIVGEVPWTMDFTP